MLLRLLSPSLARAVLISTLFYTAYAGAIVKVPFTSTIMLISSSDSNVPTTNAGLKVTVQVQAGNDQTFNDILVDTGSSFLWVGAQEAYAPGPYTQIINETFDANYGEGGATGTAYIDRVTVGGVTASAAFIGAANNTEGFQIAEPLGGISMGPANTSFNVVSGYNTTPTFVQSLAAEGAIPAAMFGVYVSPLSASGEPGSTGELTFGGVDESKFSARRKTHRSRAQAFYFGWGGEYAINTTLYSLVDTGTYFIGIPNDGLFYILQNTPDAELASSSLLEGCLTFPANASGTLPPLYVGVGSLNFTITPDDYIVPAPLYAALNITDADTIYTVLCPAGPNQYNLGMSFLEHAYSAFDLIGLAQLAPP
ncbi:hypothetical protein POSPLADRAFT_1046293 [Postia placenta MAD-698-R-SB12]|uniref:Peptidase A1 domain-containing protein n=1 Tax=Postia placenta MAD-698-R-SB12 TaxID=670580 RepID=A0A1X6N378_9APHY|nr:hypothetical protein POSPLADRAFT_1046293 [Postia placenta MAD-698-R-SB12]OSX62922.1 hypothetical protein POSPLADRAFT_1046293 [Postia placenta MAD-698-R-SB12]